MYRAILLTGFFAVFCLSSGFAGQAPSVEGIVIGVLVGLSTIALSLFAIFRPFAPRADVEKLERRMDDNLTNLSGRIDKVEQKIDSKFEGISHQLTDTFNAMERSDEARSSKIHARLNGIAKEVDTLVGSFNTVKALKEVLKEGVNSDG